MANNEEKKDEEVLAKNEEKKDEEVLAKKDDDSDKKAAVATASKDKEKEEKDRKNTVLIIIIILLALTVVILVVPNPFRDYLLDLTGFGNASSQSQESTGSRSVSGKDKSKSNENKNKLDLDESAGEWDGQLAKDEEKKKQGKLTDSIEIPGYPTLNIEANKKNVSCILGNPAKNTCYFVFELVLKDTNETIFKSKMVAPGKAIKNMNLSKPMKKGEYNAVIKITTFHEDTLASLNGANVETKLVVK